MPRNNTLVPLISKEYIQTRLAPVLAIQLVIQRLVQREDDMASSDEELVFVVAFGHEEATGARNKRCGLCREGKIKRVSKTVANVYIWV